jgi:uncharacterized protein YdaU (DUF1376 family)
MHYYKLNIGAWGLATGHLRVDEERIFLRLVKYFISNESPIPAFGYCFAGLTGLL